MKEFKFLELQPELKNENFDIAIAMTLSLADSVHAIGVAFKYLFQ